MERSLKTMEGILVASSDLAVRKSLTAIVGEGKTVHECRSVAETLALAATQKMDYVFVDGMFKDGDATELVSRLSLLGYGAEVVPILLSNDSLYLEPFRNYGVRHCLVKPFEFHQVGTVLEQIEYQNRTAANPIPPDFREFSLPAEKPESDPHSESGGATRDIDIREISQRFRRLLAQSLQQDELVAVFAEAMQEQFDIDNVVVLLPARDAPCFRIVRGHVDDEVRKQFLIPFGEPLVTALTRLGEPVWIDDCVHLGDRHAVAAIRCGERLGARVLCPVSSRGRTLAIVCLSRIHRYGKSPFLVGLLRLFLTFFAKALENAGLYSQVSSAEQAYRSIFDALPLGVVAVSGEGTIRHLNPLAASFLGGVPDEFSGQLVERAGSLLADAAREVLVTGQAAAERTVSIKQRRMQVSAVPVGETAAGGALVMLSEKSGGPSAEAGERNSGEVDTLLREMSQTLAHNFKNALVPIRTCADLLPERYQQEDFRNSFFQVVNEGVDKIDAWIASLLRFNELPNADGRKSVFALHEAMECGLEKAAARYPDSPVKPHRDCDVEDMVSMNREAVEQVFFELIANALDALQDVADPQLRLSIKAGPEGVSVCVEDNGQGIDKAEVGEVFNPFHSNKLSGLGLGLTYARKILDVYGGRVEVSAGEHGGTRIAIHFPAAVRAQLVAS
jgi:nitrogen-specific signal transduction histidine kinase/DNA-binding response OmpR family regulator